MSYQNFGVLFTTRHGTESLSDGGIFNQSVQSIFGRLVARTECATKEPTAHVCIIGDIVRRSGNLQPLIETPMLQSDWNDSAVPQTIALMASFETEAAALKFEDRLTEGLRTHNLGRELMMQSGPIVPAHPA